MVLLEARSHNHDFVAQRHHRTAHGIIASCEQRKRTLRLAHELGEELDELVASVVT